MRETEVQFQAYLEDKLNQTIKEAQLQKEAALIAYRKVQLEIHAGIEGRVEDFA